MLTFYLILALSLVVVEPSKTSKETEDVINFVFKRIKDNSGSRIPRYSSYNGHPLFTYGKKAISYHNTPAVTTYDAGVGDYGPSYTSVGGYADQQPPEDQDTHNPKKNCPEDDEKVDKPSDGDEISIEDENVYTTHKPKVEIYDNYAPEEETRHDVQDEKPPEQYKKPSRPSQSGFVYSVQTHHVMPRPMKIVYSQPQTSYGWSYEITSQKRPQKPTHSGNYISSTTYHNSKNPSHGQSYYSKKPSPKPHYHVVYPSPKPQYETVHSSRPQYEMVHTSRPQHLISSYSVHVYDVEENFDCNDHYHPGFYADVQSHCKFWHYCQPDGRHDTFKCPKSTSFNQQTLTCDWWFNVDCPSSPKYFHLNRLLNIRHQQRHTRHLQL